MAKRVISNDEMMKLEATQTPQKRVISNDQMMALEQQTAQPQPEPSKPNAFVEGAVQSATGGFADELGGLIDVGLKASGNLLLDKGQQNPYADQGITDTYSQGRDLERQRQANIQQQDPNSYLAGGLVGSIASPVNKLGVVGSGFVTGLGMSEGQNRDEILKDAATGGLIAGGTGIALDKLGGLVSKGASAIGDMIPENISQRVRDAMMNNRYGRTFLQGEGVQKFSDQANQTELANKLSQAIEDSKVGAAQGHSAARQAFTESMGQTPVQTADIANTVRQNLGKYGQDLKVGDQTFGALSDAEAKNLETYLNVLDNPVNAQELYKVWDDIKKAVEYKGQTGMSSAYNQQLKAIQAGIKDKLHTLSPELTQADASVAKLLGDAELLKSSQNPASSEQFLATLGGRNKGNVRDAVENTIGKNKDLMNELENFRTYQSFNQQGGFGSIPGARQVVGASLGSALGYGVGGDSSGGSIGAAAGAALATPQAQRYIVSKAGEAFNKATGVNGVIYDKLAPKFQQMLQEAMNRGGNAAAVTHFLLQTNDPEYQKAVKESQDIGEGM